MGEGGDEAPRKVFKELGGRRGFSPQKSKKKYFGGRGGELAPKKLYKNFKNIFGPGGGDLTPQKVKKKYFFDRGGFCPQKSERK